MSHVQAPPVERFPADVVSLDQVQLLFADVDCRDLFVKELAWNHDNKRQIYLATDLSPFSVFPNSRRDEPAMPSGMGVMQKKKPRGGDRIHGDLDFYWITTSGEKQPARSAKIIYYPQYPEVRLSGFLRGVTCIPSKYLREKSGEVYTNRLMFLGTRSDGRTFGFLAVGQKELREEVRGQARYDTSRGLNRLVLLRSRKTTEQRLLERLRETLGLGWPPGCGVTETTVVDCNSPQAVGDTLEAVGQEELREEVRGQAGYDTSRGLNRLALLRSGKTAEQRLLERLGEIHGLGWTRGCRLTGTTVVDCNSPQAVGYTLEAYLGVSANGDNAPDFEGYEVKAMTVPAFDRGDGKVVTVLTPEPDLGVYHESGVVEFLERWGYADTLGREDRQNFGGIHRVGETHKRTGLTLTLEGFDIGQPDRMEETGSLALIDADGTNAAGWSFRKLMDRWSRKHAKAVYVPAVAQKDPRRFWYGDRVMLCEGAEFLRVLAAVACGHLYLDPGVKATEWSTKSPSVHRRNQFRIKMRHVPKLYEASWREYV